MEQARSHIFQPLQKGNAESLIESKLKEWLLHHKNTRKRTLSEKGQTVFYCFCGMNSILNNMGVT